MIADDLTDLKTLGRHRIPIGETDDEDGIRIDPAGAGVMICGTSGSGKSTLTTAILERLADAGYQVARGGPGGRLHQSGIRAHRRQPEAGSAREDVTDCALATRSGPSS